MDPAAQGSFIPKQSLAAANRGSSFGLVFLIALLIFVMSIVAAGAAFGYTRLLEGQLARKDTQLTLAEGAFNAGTIQSLVRMDSRLVQAKTLLQKHVAPSALFSFLSTIVLERVQFRSLDFTLGQDGGATITLTGAADSFSTVALQSDQFGASKVLRDVIFSGISVNENGRVTFTVNATVLPELLLFSSNVNPAPASEETQPQQ